MLLLLLVRVVVHRILVSGVSVAIGSLQHFEREWGLIHVASVAAKCHIGDSVGGHWPTERTAATGSRDIVVVLALVGGDHGPQVVGRSLYVLAHWTTCSCAFVVAPARSEICDEIDAEE